MTTEPRILFANIHGSGLRVTSNPDKPGEWNTPEEISGSGLIIMKVPNVELKNAIQELPESNRWFSKVELSGNFRGGVDYYFTVQPVMVPAFVEY